MFDFNLEGWTYGPLIVIAILYFLWRFLKPGSVKKDRRSRDFKTRFKERQKGASHKNENEQDPKPLREKWNERRKF